MVLSRHLGDHDKPQGASWALYIHDQHTRELKVEQLTAQEYKGIWSRLAAQIIDGVVLLVLFVLAIYVIFRTVFADVWMSPLESYFYASVIFVSIQFIYFSILEGSTGTTVGKRALKMKVAKEDGSTCGMSASLIRNILRFVDAIPYPLYFAGTYLVDKSPKKQRLGDRVAHTVVIRTSGPSLVPAPGS